MEMPPTGEGEAKEEELGLVVLCFSLEAIWAEPARDTVI